MPVNLRAPERANGLGNHFGVVLLDLAIRSRQRLQRMLATKANMGALKRSPEPLAPALAEPVAGSKFVRAFGATLPIQPGFSDELKVVPRESAEGREQSKRESALGGIEQRSDAKPERSAQVTSSSLSSARAGCRRADRSSRIGFGRRSAATIPAIRALSARAGR